MSTFSAPTWMRPFLPSTAMAILNYPGLTVSARSKLVEETGMASVALGLTLYTRKTRLTDRNPIL
ncbi:hypothetical protein PM082_021291 [Marasmius tenuissimus]|nr:hypothetical protein PM082_021291 [Marasmius tenuissimus]